MDLPAPMESLMRQTAQMSHHNSLFLLDITTLGGFGYSLLQMKTTEVKIRQVAIV